VPDGGRAHNPMRIVLDGADLEVRAYLASQVGPTRRPFIASRGVRISAGTVEMLASNTGDGPLYVAVEMVTVGGAVVTVFSQAAQPTLGKDFTISMVANTTVLDFVLMPSEQLYALAPAIAATYAVFQVPF
jgi:hypothetical protein